MFQKIKEKLKNLNEAYINYILCITFLNLIILKINQIFFQISSIYLYTFIILISILFINQWFIITDKIKNTYVFNWFLYYFLVFKNSIYGILFEYFDYIEQEKYTKLLVFLTGFILSSWSLNIFFLILNNSYNLSILVFLILLIINIFNLIEKKIIFNTENVDNYTNQQIDYIFVKKILKINNQKFDKNKSLFYIQKRYVSFNEVKTLIKRHGITIITSATAGSLFTGYLQHSSVKVQNDSFELQKEQLEIYKKQFEYQKIKDKEDFEKWREELDLKIIKTKRKELNEVDEKIGFLNKKIHKLQVDMNSRHFWDKVDFSKTIEELKEENDILKRRRSSFESEMKIGSEIKENFVSNKKIKIDNNNSLLED